jgi:hypothetical protein
MNRFGTCGTPQSHIPIGSVVVATEGSTFIRRNPDAWSEEGDKTPKYSFTKPVTADEELSKLVILFKLKVSKTNFSVLAQV